VDTYTVPATGVYQLTADGAQGGGTLNESAGGLGADVGGDVTLTAGTASDVMQVAQNSYFPVVR
jgi:hypothetical protein